MQQLEEFKDYLIKRKISSNTVKTYLSGARSYLKQCQSHGGKFTAFYLELYLTRLFFMGKSPASIKSTLYQVRSFCRFMKHKGVRVDPLIEALEPLQAWQSSQALPSPDQMKSILEIPPCQTFEGLRDRCLMGLLYDCGLRLTEALDLKIADIDLKRAKLTIPRRLRTSSRFCPLMDITCSLLMDYLPTRLFEGDLLFQDVRGKHLSTLKIFPKLVKQIETLKLPFRVTPNQFRQACTVHLLASGADLKSVHAFLGQNEEMESEAVCKVYFSTLSKMVKDHHPRAKLRG